MTAKNEKKVEEILHWIEERAPSSAAEEWDNVGLLVGDPQWKTSGAVISIDLTEESIELATQSGMNLIVNHHPCIFPKNPGISRWVAGDLAFEAMRRGVSVISCHTNFDRSALEVVHRVAEGLGAEIKGRLYDSVDEQRLRMGEGLLEGSGYGFWGEFRHPRPFPDLVKGVRTLFEINGFWITNPAPSQVARVGFSAGKGSSFVESAASVRCDLLITGEVGYHNALQGQRLGLAVMELGHRESEKFFIETMRTWLLGLGIRVIDVQTPTQMIWSGGKK
jgi:dinuclear metal center YbgI/SA1388 family protein